jgi:uncharacterized membrane protein YccC
VAAAASYLLALALNDVEPFLVIMMAVTSLQRSVGGTMGQALIRLQSAVVGSLIGFLCLALLPAGWGTAVALAVSLFVVGAASALQSSWALAVVPAVGMSLEGKDDLLNTALVTSAGILLGAAVGSWWRSSSGRTGRRRALSGSSAGPCVRPPRGCRTLWRLPSRRATSPGSRST